MTERPASCRWCGKPFRRRTTGGRTQLYCRPRCRRDFHAAARSFGLVQLSAGRGSRAEPGSAATATHTLARVPEVGSGYPRQRKAIVVALDVLPEGVADLRRAGWLTGNADDDAVADAVSSLVQRALALRLRP